MQSKTFFIAEIGVNYNGDLDMARRLVNVAAEAGADCAKFQTFTADSLVTKDAEAVAYQKRDDASLGQYKLLKSLELSHAHHEALVQHCADVGIEFMSTAFDLASLDYLLSLGVKRLKIPSGEITNAALVEACARSGLPVIISTGMATLVEVQQAVATLKAARKGNALQDVTILHCTSAYPAPLEDINLKAMHTLQVALGLPVGYSDHTLGVFVPPLAVAAGASLIEKHITLDRSLPGPDHAASIEPEELKQLICTIRLVETMLGDGVKVPKASELQARRLVRKGLKYAKDLPEGHILSASDMVVLRPESGLPPAMAPNLVGKSLLHSVKGFAAIASTDLSE